MDGEAGEGGYYRFLRSVYFFESLTDDEIKLLEQVCHEQTFSAGEVIFREGAEADRFYIVLGGLVEVWREHGTENADLLAQHGVGHLFGEMSLIDDLPRSATITSRIPTRVLFIPRESFRELISTHSSIAISLLKSVSAVVRKSNDSFVDGLRERNAELERLYEDLQKTQAELLRNERLSALGKFSSLILHDIKNPLSVLRGFAELIVLTTGDREKVEGDAKRIIRETDRISALVNELLDYARGEIRLTVSAISLQDFIADVVENLEPRLTQRGVDIDTEVRYAGPVIMDVQRMMRVMSNLSDNALKAMPKGGRFSIVADRRGDSYVLEVADTGVGMTQEVIDSLFEPFFSFSERGGTGLGMAIVRSIVEAHHGRVDVRSTPGEGTTFTISLPPAPTRE